MKLPPVLLLWVTLSVCALQAQVRTQAANPDSALQSVLDQLEGQRLSLRDAVSSALKNATSVRIAEAAYLAARGAARRERGVFDPEIFLLLHRLDQDQATASFFSGAPILETSQTSTRAGLRWESPIGTTLEASLNTIRAKSNSVFAFLNPQYTAFTSLSFRQPLLGGWFVSARKNLRKADADLDAAKARYDQERLGIEATVERAYWDLYAAERDFAVQWLLRERAQTFLREAELRARIGLVGPNQVANARTFLAEQEIQFLDREEQRERLADQFASLIGWKQEPGTRKPVTMDKPPDEFLETDENALVEQALKGNLDLLAARSDVEARRALSSAGIWEALPTVDLVGSLGGSGLTGTARDVIFGNDTLRTTRGGTYNEAVRQAIERDFPTWSIGVEVSIPLLFRKGTGEKERLDAEVTLAEQREIQLLRMVQDQVRSSYRELAHGRRRLKAAREGVEAAQEQVRIGLIEFQNGRATAFELVRLGADFAVAQQRYTQALVRGAKAAAALRQLTSGWYPDNARK